MLYLSGLGCILIQIILNYWLTTAFGATVLNQTLISFFTFLFLGVGASLGKKDLISTGKIHIFLGFTCIVLGISFPSLPLWLGSFSENFFIRMILTKAILSFPLGCIGMLIPKFGLLIGADVKKNIDTIYMKFHILSAIFIILGELILFYYMGMKGLFYFTGLLFIHIGYKIRGKEENFENPDEKLSIPWKLFAYSLVNGLIQVSLLKANAHFFGPFPENYSALIATSLFALFIAGLMQSKLNISWENFKKGSSYLVTLSFFWLLGMSYLSQYVNSSLMEMSLHWIRLGRLCWLILTFFPIYLSMSLLIPVFLRKEEKISLMNTFAFNSWGNGLGILLGLIFIGEMISLKIMIFLCLLFYFFLNKEKAKDFISLEYALVGILFVPIFYFHMSYRFFEDPNTFSYFFNKMTKVETFSKLGAQVDLLSLGDEKMLVIDGYKSVKLNQDGQFNESEILLGALQGYAAKKRDKALILGVGSGATVTGNAESYKKVTGVEIHPVILDLQEEFRPYNKDLVEKKNVSLILDDGFTYLLAAKDKFDLITNNVPTPQYSVASQLWTKEFLEIVKDKLTDEGFYSQWIDGAINIEAVKVIFSTLQSVFSHCYFGVVTSTYGNLFCFKKDPGNYYERIASISNLMPYRVFPIKDFDKLDFGTEINSLNRSFLKKNLNPYLSKAWRNKKDWFLLDMLKINPTDSSERMKHCMALESVKQVKESGLPAFCRK